MEKITTIKNEDFGEIRIGIDDNCPAEACVSLALNHFEDDEQWGAQPLSPEMAKRIGNALLAYAAKAHFIRTGIDDKLTPLYRD